MKRSNEPGAFTLIELLVVITIIVVLLALLAPALDKAVYQAQLAACGANLHAIGTGVLTYAAHNKRRYPHRAGVHDAGSNWHPHKIWNGATGGNARDDRPLLRDYMSINGVLNDPLAEKADFANAKAGSQTYASYYLWFGFKFVGQKGMDRLGDRFTWTEGSSPAVTSEFDILAGDHDDVRYLDTISATFSAHPDADAKLHSELYQDAGSPQSVIARWASKGAVGRGSMEMNFVSAGGDVRRFDAVEQDDDKRLIKVGVYNGATNTLTQWSHLPRR